MEHLIDLIADHDFIYRFVNDELEIQSYQLGSKYGEIWITLYTKPLKKVDQIVTIPELENICVTLPYENSRIVLKNKVYKRIPIVIINNITNSTNASIERCKVNLINCVIPEPHFTNKNTKDFSVHEDYIDCLFTK